MYNQMIEMANGKYKHIGYFTNEDEAGAAYTKAYLEQNVHKRKYSSKFTGVVSH